jgi:hypothetical protein
LLGLVEAQAVVLLQLLAVMAVAVPVLAHQQQVVQQQLIPALAVVVVETPFKQLVALAHLVL